MPEKYFILIWLPTLFMLHDFEEIILLKAWIQHNSAYLLARFPRLGQRIIQHFENFSTASFGLGVAEEFLIVTLITMGALLNPAWLLLWFGTFMAFTLHLVYHILTALILRRYVAASATSLAFLPVCIFLLVRFLALYPFGAMGLVLWSILAFVIVVTNLAFLHTILIPKFNRL